MHTSQVVNWVFPYKISFMEGGFSLLIVLKTSVIRKGRFRLWIVVEFYFRSSVMYLTVFCKISLIERGNLCGSWAHLWAKHHNFNLLTYFNFKTLYLLPGYLRFEVYVLNHNFLSILFCDFCIGLAVFAVCFDTNLVSPPKTDKKRLIDHKTKGFYPIIIFFSYDLNRKHPNLNFETKFAQIQYELTEMRQFQNWKVDINC